MDIKPSVSGHEWTIRNINLPFGSTCELYQSDGSIDILILTTSNSLLSYDLLCNVSTYYRVKNVSGSTITVSYNGVVTKE